jgi:integrase/recombinase XerD
MDTASKAQRTITETVLNDHLESWCEAFLMDRRAVGKSAGTLKYYRVKLRGFCNFCESRAITRIGQITAGELRAFLLHLQDTEHSAGGVHGFYRAVKAFLRWYEAEAEPDGWKNPIRKVKLSKPTQPPLEPVELVNVKALIKTCAGGGLLDLRDKAALLMLLDTGARASEFCALNLEDIDLITGAAIIWHGKGDKSRTVFMGKATRRAMRAYLKERRDDHQALWITERGGRLTYGGLRSLVVRRSKLAGIPEPSLHAFRRAFALNCLRAGMDIYSLQELMGHADLQVLRHYLALLDDDLRAAHSKASPADQL